MSAPDSVPGLDVVDDGPIRRLTLNRPKKRNAMTIAMFDGLTRVVEDAVLRDETRVIVLRGAGEHFCSGVELEAPAAGDGPSTDRPPKPRTGHLQRTFRYSAHRMVRTLFEAEVPIVTGVRGWAAGIGNVIALSGDHVVAGRSAKFWVPFVTRGFTPDSGTTFLLPRLVGVARAKEMILRGKPVDGERAVDWGLVNEVVDDEDVDAAVEEVAQEFARAATLAVGLAKQLVYRNLGSDLAGALEQEALTEELAVRSEDFKEGMRAFAQRRDPDYQGR